jgi:hypothetical protein
VSTVIRRRDAQAGDEASPGGLEAGLFIRDALAAEQRRGGGGDRVFERFAEMARAA